MEVGGTAVAVDVHSGSRGDGILVGTQEEELPLIDLGLVLDLVADLVPVEDPGGILLTISHDRDDDLAGALGLGSLRQALSEIIDREADGIE